MGNRYAMVENNGSISGIVLWDGITPYDPPDGVTLIECPQDCTHEFTYENGEFIPPEIENEPPPPSIPSAVIIAMTELKVIDFGFSGIETAIGLGGAFFIDVGIIWVFLSEVQDDNLYLPFAQCPGFNVDVTARELDYFEVTVTDRVSNQPAMPGSISISVQRVK